MNRYFLDGDLGTVRIKYHGGTRDVLFDALDFNLISQHQWYVAEGGEGGLYVIAKVNRKTLRMHRLLMGCPDHLHVDHINGNGLDNRRVNLRNVTRETNMLNRKSSVARSGFRGVRIIRAKRTAFRYEARVIFRGSQINLGRFSNPIDAALACAEALRRIDPIAGRTYDRVHGLDILRAIDFYNLPPALAKRAA